MKSKKRFNLNEMRWIIQASLAAFGAYFCMYAFRKPFSVATFQDIIYWGIDYKILLIIAQIIGYTLSKFIGIRVIATLPQQRRAWYLLSFIFVAELSLLCFALIPRPYNIICMFFNGLPLGMVWGIVFSYLEGRRFTEIMGVILCTSFIVSSGVVKSIGIFVMEYVEVTEFWMPVITGAIFIIPIILCTIGLELIPKPTVEDIRLRSKRNLMTYIDRKRFFKQHRLPMIALIIFYTILTAFRDFRDNFTRELWDGLGYGGDISVYTTAELIIAFVVLIILGLQFLIKDNFKAFTWYHNIIILALILMGISTLGFQKGIVNPYLWMIASGFGLYMCYVPFNSLFFDRMIAAFKFKANAGYFIYMVDAYGYLGSILVLFYKNFASAQLSWVKFFVYGTYTLIVIGLITIYTSLIYFKQKKEQRELSTQELHI